MMPADALPVITGSREEQSIHSMVCDVLENGTSESEYGLTYARRILECIPARAPFFPEDLVPLVTGLERLRSEIATDPGKAGHYLFAGPLILS